LVEGLLALVMTAAQAGAAVTADGIDLIDEYDAGLILFGLVEEVANPAGADTHEHLDEVRAADGEERNARLAGDGAREEELPVPGGQNNSTPLGMRAPKIWKRLGFSRKSLISSSSSTASSTPATSLKVIFGWSTATLLARDLPKLMTLLPPPCIWFMRKMKKTTIRSIGAMVPSSVTHTELF
jgi:hypothetical protein